MIKFYDGDNEEVFPYIWDEFAEHDDCVCSVPQKPVARLMAIWS